MLPSALKQKLAAAKNGKPSVKPVHQKKRKHESADVAVAADAPKPKRKVNTKSAAMHRKPLTTDEINSLQESANTLTNENLFTLQIDEILRAGQIHAQYAAFLDDWLVDFNTFLGKLPSDGAKIVSATLPRSAGVPFDETGLLLPAFQYQFIAPTSPAALIGSQTTATIVGPAVHVDIAVTMPAACFQKDNYMSLVYHKKRALYLHRLAGTLAAWPRAGPAVRFAFFRGDRLRPVIQLAPRVTGLRHLRINIHAIGEQNTFKLSRFLPATSNVRAALFGDADDAAELAPTPHYNASILRDLTLPQNEQFVQRILQPAEQRHVREAIILFKLWLRTRGLEASAFGGHLASALAVHLIKQRRVHVTMSTVDVLRQLWIQLATSRWHEPSGGASLTPQPAVALEVFAQHYDVVFVDVSGYLNLCAQLPLDVYLRVREESGRALRFLTEATLSNFRLLFAGRRPTYQQYDHVINISRDANLPFIVRADCYRAQFHDHCGQVLPIALDLVSGVLRQGFGKRIDSLTPVVPATPTWLLTEKMPTVSGLLSFGVILNAEFCTDVLDKGPQADQEEEADAFRSFWGERAEMRRFQDGSIVEACVWTSPAAPIAVRRLICKQIALHLLQHHFTIKPTNVRYVADQLDLAYRLDASKVVVPATTTSAGVAVEDSNSEHLALAVVKSFDDLGRVLRSLDNIPLGITDVTGASPVFRYCEVEPIVAHASVATDDNDDDNNSSSSTSTSIYQSYAVLDAVIELSASGRWPDNLIALQRLKAAFCLRIAAGLRDQHKLAARTDGQSVDIIKDGFHYRVRIALAKELMLLKRQLNAKGAVAYRDNEASRAYERDLLRLPRLTVLLHTLYHQHSSFGPAVQIAKRWLRAQLIDTGLWPDECAELLMARVYTQPDSWQVPAQPQAAFVRWLQLLASSDWRAEMVVLNFGGALSEVQLARLESRFANDRDAFPLLSIVTAASTTTTSTVAAGESAGSGGSAAKDSSWTVWSAEAPVREVVARVAVLAAHSLAIVEESVWGGETGAAELQPAQLFVPSLEGYDVVIRMRRGKLQQSNLCEFVGTRRGRTVDEAPPAADFNVAQKYLAELRAAYAEFALFFYDPCGGDTIAVMWKPAVRVEREFAASTVVGCHEREDADGETDTKYVCNLKQIVEDFRVIGHGLVETVTEANAE